MEIEFWITLWDSIRDCKEMSIHFDAISMFFYYYYYLCICGVNVYVCFCLCLGAQMCTAAHMCVCVEIQSQCQVCSSIAHYIFIKLGFLGKPGICQFCLPC